MRWLRISTKSIQTAGYSEQSVPEIRIEAIEHAEELQELIRTLVRQSGSSVYNEVPVRIPLLRYQRVL